MRRLLIGVVMVMVVAGCGGDDNPTAPSTGSCCLANGTCTMTAQANCTGTWISGGVCEPNTCVQPDGACCAPDGTCRVTQRTICTGTSVWTVFGVCDPNPCPPPTGACCALDGTCTLSELALCTGTSTWTIFGVCDPNSCPPPVAPYLLQTSPANVLANMQRSFADRAIDQYRKLLADDFTFVFNPADVAIPDDPTPVQWGLADEFAAMNNMFRSELVEYVELHSYVLGAPEWADSLYYGPRAWKVRVDNARFLVATRREDGELLIYVVEGTTERLYFREDPTRLIGGRPTWYIFRWEDQPFGGVKTEGTSWGRVKAHFR